MGDGLIVFLSFPLSVRNYSPSAPFAASSPSSAASSSRQPVASTSTAPDLGWIEVTPKADIKKAKREAKKAALSSSVTSAEQIALDAESRKLAAKVCLRLSLLHILRSCFKPVVIHLWLQGLAFLDGRRVPPSTFANLLFTFLAS